MNNKIFRELVGNTFFTPEWCFNVLPIDWTKYKTAHEPSAGDGRIHLFLEEQGVEEVSSSEIYFLEMEDQTADETDNFFNWNGSVDLIIGNPPYVDTSSGRMNYDLSIEFIKHALPRCKTLMFFLPLGFLGSKGRYDLLFNNPPDTLFIMNSYIEWGGRKDKGPRPPLAWIIWQQGVKHIPSGIYNIDRDKEPWRGFIDTTLKTGDDFINKTGKSKEAFDKLRTKKMKEIWKHYNAR